MRAVYYHHSVPLTVKTCGYKPLTYKQGQSLPVYTGLITDENGIRSKDNLEAGTYYFVQTSAPSGYLLPSVVQSDSFTVLDQPGVEQSKIVTFTNAVKARGSAEIILKKNSSNSAINGAVFELYKDGIKYREGLTDSEGRILFDNLEAGAYSIRQKSSIPGMDISEVTSSFDIYENGTIDQDFTFNYTNDEVSGNVTLNVYKTRSGDKYNQEIIRTFSNLKPNVTYQIRIGVPANNILNGDQVGYCEVFTPGQVPQGVQAIDNNDWTNSGDPRYYTVYFTPTQNNKTYDIAIVSINGWGFYPASAEILNNGTNNQVSVNKSVRSSLKTTKMVMPGLLGDTGPVTHSDATLIIPSGYGSDPDFPEQTITLSGTKWEETIPNLDKYDDNGELYYYYIVETDRSPADYWVESYSAPVGGSNGTLIIKNKKITTGSVQIRKTIISEDNVSLPDNFEITASWIINGEEKNVVLTLSSAGITGSGTTTDPYIWTINDIPVGTVVSFTESGIQIDGYSLEVNNVSVSAESSTVNAPAIVAEQVVGASLINNYSKNPGDLELTKKVAGDGADRNHAFTFNVNLTFPETASADTSYTTKIGTIAGTSVTVSAGSNTATASVNLTADQTYTIIGLPAGTTYTIEEIDPSAYGYSPQTTKGELNGTIKGGTTAKEEVEVTNTFNSGGLTVEKIIEGNAKDITKDFSFQVTITRPNNASGNHGQYKIGENVYQIEFTKGTAVVQFTLKGGEEAVFSKLQKNSTYIIEELSADQDGYVTTVSSVGGTVSDGKKVTGTLDKTTAITAIYTNTKNTTELEASKVWKSGEQTITWPEDVESVKFTLFKTVNGEKTIVDAGDLTDYMTDTSSFANPASITKNTAAHKVVWDNLPTKKLINDTWCDISYSVEETEITYTNKAKAAGQTDLTTAEAIASAYGNPSYNAISKTITNEIPTVDISATKQWKDKEGNILPIANGKQIPSTAKVTFTLLSNNNSTSHIVELNGVDETQGGTVVKTGDYEGADWTAHFTGLPKYTSDGNIIKYTIRETGKWNGYAVDGNDTVDDGGTIVNKEQSINISIIKIDKESEEHLAGAKFRLKQYDTSYSTEIADLGEKEVSSEGTLNYTGLTIGCYEVEETKSPDGYNRISEKPRFEVGVNETTKELEISYENDTEGMVTYDASNKTFTVRNTSGAELPFTGGSGTWLYTILGAILALGAVMLLIWKRKHT